MYAHLSHKRQHQVTNGDPSHGVCFYIQTVREPNFSNLFLDNEEPPKASESLSGKKTEEKKAKEEEQISDEEES